MNYYITLKSMLGHVARYAIEQSPYTVPDNLTAVIEELAKRAEPCFKDGMPSCVMWHVDASTFEAFLRKELLTIPEVELWNQAKADPSIQIAFVTRYSQPEPDKDFIDLGALVRNITNEIFREAERHSKT